MQVIVGKVISAKMNATVVVEVTRQVPHPKYHKLMRRTTKYHARVPFPVKEGEMVKIQQTRPWAKTTYFKVIEKVP